MASQKRNFGSSIQVFEEDDELLVPIHLPEGAESHRVVDDVFRQVCWLVSRCESPEDS